MKPIIKVIIPAYNEAEAIVNVINDIDLQYQKNGDVSSLNFILDEIVPNEKYHLEYYQKMFKSILEFLKSKNINTLFWKHTDFWYPKFSLETIAKDTKFKIKDGIILNI